MHESVQHVNVSRSGVGNWRGMSNPSPRVIFPRHAARAIRFRRRRNNNEFQVLNRSHPAVPLYYRHNQYWAVNNAYDSIRHAPEELAGEA